MGYVIGGHVSRQVTSVRKRTRTQGMEFLPIAGVMREQKMHIYFCLFWQ